MSKALINLTKYLLYPLWILFDQSTKNPKARQVKLLNKIFHTYKTTQKYQELLPLKDYEEFANKIPLVQYDDIAQDMLLENRNQENILIPNKVLSWEKTSGSTSRNKLIPYTQDFRRMITTAFLAWAADLLIKGPKFESGVNFLSLSPSSSLRDQTAYQDDSDYLPSIVKLFFAEKFVLPKNLHKINNTKNFFIVLILHLLEREDLESFFIWSPTYLISLMNQLEEDFDEILAHADEGEIQVAGQYYSFNFSTERILQVRQNRKTPGKIWPNLKLISMWTDGHAAHFVQQVQDLFPDVMIQGKGLIATEAISTIPWIKSQGQLPLTSHIFYEFKDKEGNIYPLWKIEPGRTYELIISHLSGLLRYQTNDQILVEGFYHKTPLIRFIGRSKRVIDMTGEKMSEEMVNSIFKKVENHTSFLVPVHFNSSLPYYLCISNNLNEARLEADMTQYIHYKESRKLNQLGPIKVHYTQNPIQLYKELHMNRGMTFGDIKFSSLITKPVSPTELNQLGIQ